MTQPDLQNQPVQIAESVYWVGSSSQEGGLHCNAYLIHEENESILIDPGSVLDFEFVKNKIEQVTSVKQISTIITNHQDPDLCSSIPLFEKAGFEGEIATHWRSAVIIQYYGICSPFYLTNENGNKLVMKSGRTIHFIPTPYLHFPGAVTSYDEKTGILFSSDLFGAFSNNWQFYAVPDTYIEAMKIFHENYMPSNEILRPVMEKFSLMNIEMIAPQHGSIIKDQIPLYINTLKNLECGAFLKPVKKELGKSGGYQFLCGQILKRLASVFPKNEICQIFQKSSIQINPDDLTISDFDMTGEKLWHTLFDLIFSEKGGGWLSIIEVMVEKITTEYGIPLPRIFHSKLAESEKQIQNLTRDMTRLKEKYDELQNSLHDTQLKMITCPITGLYNELFYHEFIMNEISRINETADDLNFCVLIFSIDKMDEFNLSFGQSASEEVYQTSVRIIREQLRQNDVLFKLSGSMSAAYLPETTIPEAKKIAEQIRNKHKESNSFLKKKTLSIGIASISEITEIENSTENIEASLFNIGHLRLKTARNKGGDQICASSPISIFQNMHGAIAVAETDLIHLDILKTSLENLKYHVITAENGSQLLKEIEAHHPDLIITELMLPQIDAFSIRETMLKNSELKNTPFILLSYEKKESSIQRSFELQISYFLKKPYLLSELTGKIKELIKQDI